MKKESRISLLNEKTNKQINLAAGYRLCNVNTEDTIRNNIVLMTPLLNDVI